MKIKNLLFAVTSSLLLCSCATIDKPTTNAADQPFDLFPQTKHLECVATLRKKKA